MSVVAQTPVPTPPNLPFPGGTLPPEVLDGEPLEFSNDIQVGTVPGEGPSVPTAVPALGLLVFLVLIAAVTVYMFKRSKQRLANVGEISESERLGALVSDLEEIAADAAATGRPKKKRPAAKVAPEEPAPAVAKEPEPERLEDYFAAPKPAKAATAEEVLSERLAATAHLDPDATPQDEDEAAESDEPAGSEVEGDWGDDDTPDDTGTPVDDGWSDAGAPAGKAATTSQDDTWGDDTTGNDEPKKETRAEKLRRLADLIEAAEQIPDPEMRQQVIDALIEQQNDAR
jgi:hypothetical protein